MEPITVESNRIRPKSLAFSPGTSNPLPSQLSSGANTTWLPADSFRRLVETIETHAIFMMDTSGTILSWNRGAQELTGYAAQEIIGKNFSIFYPAEQVNSAHPEYELRKATVDGKYHEEGWRVRGDRTTFWASVTITSIRDEDGTLLGFGKVVQDLTEKKKVQDAIKLANAGLEARVVERTYELEAQRKELLRSNSDLEQFACIASHDLKEPLRTITTHLQLLKRNASDALNKEASECLDNAVNGASRMRNLIDDLLIYAKIENSSENPPATDFNVVIKDVVAALEHQIEEAGGELTVEPLPTIPAEFNQMVRLFLNLVTNAIKYRSSERAIKIHINSQESPHFWTFSIADNGIGIARESWLKVFEIFRRLDRDSEGAYGAGLGLAICKKIVERHKGRIWVESRPGIGSIFYFTIPKI